LKIEKSKMKINLKKKATKHCANWDNGKCLGCMFGRDGDNNLFFYMDSDYSGKGCKVNEGCDYFDNIVVPGIKEK